MPAKPNPEVDRLKVKLHNAEVALDVRNQIFREQDHMQRAHCNRLRDQLLQRDDQIQELEADKMERELLIQLLLHKVNVLEDFKMKLKEQIHEQNKSYLNSDKNKKLVEKNVELRYAVRIQGANGDGRNGGDVNGNQDP